MDLRSMCGRFTLRTPLKTVALLFDLSEDAVDAAAGRSPRFNIAPSQEIAAVRHRVAGNPRELVWLRWGLVPHWADAPDTAAPMINARAETLTSRPAFREAFAERRCLIPADGFFEWKRTGGRGQPYYIRLADEQPFALAGLWEHWQRGSTQLESCTIITTDANELLRPIHHRMPVILPREHFDAWLDPLLEDRQRLATLLRPYLAPSMVAYPVGSAVNSTGHDGPQCILPAVDDKVQGSLFD